MFMSDDIPKPEKLTAGDLMNPSHPNREEFIEATAAFLKNNKDIIEAVSTGFNVLVNIINKFMPAAFQALSETISSIREANEQRQLIYPKIVHNLDYLASHCWFLSMEIGLTDFEEQALSLESIPDYQNRDDLVNECFLAFYKKNLNYLSNSIITDYPERAFAITPAIEAHNRGDYALSIPVFFAQADGILLSITELELFSAKGHISHLARKKISSDLTFENWRSLIAASAWKPLSDKRPFGWSLTERNRNSYTGLNRNTILHGIDLNYATEINSYKAFSLLAYISSLKGILEEYDVPDEIKQE